MSKNDNHPIDDDKPDFMDKYNEEDDAEEETEDGIDPKKLKAKGLHIEGEDGEEIADGEIHDPLLETDPLLPDEHEMLDEDEEEEEEEMDLDDDEFGDKASDW